MKTTIKFIAFALCAILLLNTLSVRGFAADASGSPITDLLLTAAQKPDLAEGSACGISTPFFAITVKIKGSEKIWLWPSNACYGFCFRLLEEAFDLDLTKSIPFTFQGVKADVSFRKSPFEDVYSGPADIRPADILVWSSHCAVCILNDAQNQTLVLAEGNYNGRCHYGRIVSYTAVNNSVNYIMRLSNTVTAPFAAPASAPSIPFTDMPESGSPEYEAICYCYDHDYISGISPSLFGTGLSLSRAMCATILLAVDRPSFVETSATLPFSDIRSGKYFVSAVYYCEYAGYMHGFTDGTWRPKGKLTRAEIVTIIYSMCGRPGISIANPFRDCPANRYFSVPAIYACEAGFIEIDESGCFYPDAYVTREEFCLILYRFLTGNRLAN